jgi:hypothetical protein
MWQRFLINLAKYRTASILTESVHDAIMILGANGIIEDFTILPRLLRDSMIVETWEGTHNTLCLQIMRDAAKSDLIGRWRIEIENILEQWSGDFLPQTRSNFEQTFRRTCDELATIARNDGEQAAANARYLTDRLGILLELSWLARHAFRSDNDDAGAAVLTVIAYNRALNPPTAFPSQAFQATREYWLPLIEESNVSAITDRF